MNLMFTDSIRIHKHFYLSEVVHTKMVLFTQWQYLHFSVRVSECRSAHKIMLYWGASALTRVHVLAGSVSGSN